jgi:translation initiation factor 5A
MSEVTLKNAGSLQRGNYVMIENVASVVSSVDISKPGKHGATKARVEAVGMIDGKKRQWLGPAAGTMECPIVEKRTAQVLSVNANSANVMDMETFETYDLVIPNDLQEQVVEGCTVLYWQIVNDKVMKQVMKQA